MALSESVLKPPTRWSRGTGLDGLRRPQPADPPSTCERPPPMPYRPYRTPASPPAPQGFPRDAVVSSAGLARPMVGGYRAFLLILGCRGLLVDCSREERLKVGPCFARALQLEPPRQTL